MDHLPKLIVDLALILLTGAVVTLLFKAIRQPVVLGYIIAGFMVGPHLSLVPTVVDNENVRTLAEIGIIFLLFSLGLEFNIKKLVHIGGPASITAITEIIFITLSGYILGKILGWSTMDSIFLGGMLASSSTTIIIKAFDDLGMRSEQFARIVFGVLIVEDIVVILLLVLLPTIAVAREFEGMQLLITFLKLFAFLIIMFIIGIFLLPPLFRRARKIINEETLLILSTGLCLGMVVLATANGFSAELGAFIMGFILAESTSAERVEDVIKPVKDLFAAVFFVSIGMMIDPSMMIKNSWSILAVTALTIFGKLISTSAGALISGQPLKQSVRVGMSMAQIGEFAFIVATLGLSLGVISDFLFPVAVGASVITTFITPYMIKYSDNLFLFIEKSLPESWLSTLNRYNQSTRTIIGERSWKKVLRTYITVFITNAIITIVLIILSINFLLPFLDTIFKNYILSGLVDLLITMAIISPFLWGMMAKRPNDTEYKALWLNRKYNHGPLLMIEIIRIASGIIIIGFLVDEIFSTYISLLVLVPVIFIILVFFSKQLRKFYHRLEERFLFNLGSVENVPPDSRQDFSRQIKEFNLYPWDAHIVELVVSPQAGFIGKTLEQLAWRERFGINVAYVKRGDELICSPTKYSKLYPSDRIGIIATDEQIRQFKPLFEASENIHIAGRSIEDIVIRTIVVNDSNRLKGLSIKNSGIREKTNGLVIGIERNNERILNPPSDTIFEKGDVVWIVGEREKIQQLIDKGI